MKNVNFIIFAIIAFITLYTGCKKKDDPVPVQSKKEILGSKKWYYESFKLDGEEGIADCEKNNFYQFAADGKFTFTDSSPLCDEQDPSFGTWKFGPGESTILITDTVGTANYKIETLNSSALVLSYSVELEGVKYSVVDTYTGK